MSKFSQPADRIVKDIKEYADARIQGVKLDTVRGLSEGTSAFAGIILILSVAGTLLLTLSFAAVMLLGEALNSYATAAFIVAGVLALLLVVLILCRKILFKNTFVHLFGNIFGADESIGRIEDIDLAKQQSEENIKAKEDKLGKGLEEARSFYTPARVLGEGFRHGVLPFIANLLTDKKK